MLEMGRLCREKLVVHRERGRLPLVLDIKLFWLNP
jgi:hypothetical protein